MLSFPLVLSPSLEEDRLCLEVVIQKGHELLKAFADSYDWGHLLLEPFIVRAEIVDSQTRLLEIVHELCEIPEGTVFPDTLSAGLEQHVFFSLSPELYRSIYPEGDEPDSFAKLVCHEMVHRLHVRILKGDEDAMGPIWFFEGFAVVGSNQFASQALDLTRAEREAIILSKSRGSYERYGKVLRYLLQFADLPTLVSEAGKPDFNDYVLSLGI